MSDAPQISAATTTISDGTEKNTYPFSFTGRGSEYFSIWIVNLALTILTLGIYGAWAKVRRMNWFYGHTFLDGHNFVYHAQPMQILKGRIIGIALLLAYLLTSHFTPALGVALSLALMVATPWLLRSSLRFTARMTSYRGLRFDFTGSTGQAFWVFLLLPALGILSLGLLMPYATQQSLAYVARNTFYGSEIVTWEGKAKDFWKMHLKGGAAILLALLLGVGVFAVGLLGQYSFMESIGAFFDTSDENSGVDPITRRFLFMYLVPMFILIYIGFFMYTAVVRAQSANLLYNGAKLNQFGFNSTQKGRSLGALMLLNSVLGMLTFGLYQPWAKVAVAKYRARHLAVVGPGSLDSFIAGAQKDASAIGDSVGDILDIDISIG